jgi:hypothetical protein
LLGSDLPKILDKSLILFIVAVRFETMTLSGQNISLLGSWKSGNRQYEAKYAGTFVRRRADLKGTQTWNDGGKTINRDCSGTIKRPLRMPREKKQP